MLPTIGLISGDELFFVQYLNYRRHFKKIFQQEKEVEEQRKNLMALHPKVIKARKQVQLFRLGLKICEELKSN